MTATSTGAILRRGALPDETVINSEIVALEESGTPTFHALQHPGSAKSAIFYYVFDVLILSSRNVMSEPLSERRAFLSRHVLANLDEPIRHSPELKASLSDL